MLLSKRFCKLIETMEKIKVNDHLCLIYETPEAQLATVVPYIRIGLERGEKCIYIADDNSTDVVLSAFRREGIDVDFYLITGALTIAGKQETYLKMGHFDPDWMIKMIQQTVQAAQKDGFTSLRATGEMTWALGGDPGAERLSEYEAKLNSLFPSLDCLALCQYNRKRFCPESIQEAIKNHPTVIYVQNDKWIFSAP